jgi:hypothetical protein
MTKTKTKTKTDIKTGTKALAGKNGYVSVKLNATDAKLVQEKIDKAGITDAIQADKLHATLFYAKAGLPDSLVAAEGAIHTAFIKPTPMVIGEDPWRALVLELDCPSLVARHDEIKQSTGGEHSYPDFLPHMSLKYSPSEDDIKLVGEAFAGMVIRLTHEATEDIAEDPADI